MGSSIRVSALAFVLLVGAFPSVRADEEMPHNSDLRVLWTEWETKVEEIRNSDQTTIDKIAALKELAENSVVIYRGKILDIKPNTRHGPGGVEVECIGVCGGSPRQNFIFRPDKAHQVKGWKKWDRLEWRATPTVHGLNRIEFQLQFNGAADLNRKPNPGPEFANLPGQTLDYARWRRDMNRYVRTGDSKRAWKKWTEIQGKYWSYTTKVLSVSRGQIGIQQLDGTNTTHVRVEDPQAMEVLKVGAEVVLACSIHGNAKDGEDVIGKRGRPHWSWRYRFWGIKR